MTNKIRTKKNGEIYKQDARKAYRDAEKNGTLYIAGVYLNNRTFAFDEAKNIVFETRCDEYEYDEIAYFVPDYKAKLIGKVFSDYNYGDAHIVYEIFHIVHY